MSIEKKSLEKAFEVLRNDAGIFGAMQSIEQLSWLIFLKCLGEAGLKSDFSNNINREINSINIFEDVNNIVQKCIHDSEINFINDDVFYYLRNNSYYFSDSTIELNESAGTIFSTVGNRITSIENLKTIFKILSSVNFLDNNRMEEAFEKLIEIVIKSEGQSGQFSSPKVIIKLITETLEFEESSRTVYDPTLGTGGFLIEAFKQCRALAKQDDIELTGFEVHPTAYLLALVKMLIQKAPTNKIILRNALENSKNSDNRKYDVVFSHPPFFRLNNSDSSLENNSELGTSDALFFEHIIDKLKNNGIGAVILPDRFLFDKKKSHVALRQKIIDNCNLHTIIRLPSGVMLPYTAVKLSIIFFDKKMSNTKEFWTYDLSLRLSSTTTKKLTYNDFEDFFHKHSIKELSEYSWVTKKENLDESCDLSAKNLMHFKKDKKLDPIYLASILKEKNKELDNYYGELFEWLQKNSIKTNAKITSTTIEDIFHTTTGKRLISKKDIKDTGPYPVYGGNGVIGYYDNYNITNENIIIGRVGGLSGNIHYINEKAWVTDNAFYITLKKPEIIHMPYLAKILKLINLNKIASGTGQPYISYSKIKDIAIGLPSFEEQIKLDNLLDELFKVIKNIENQMEYQKKYLYDVVERINDNLIK